MGYDANGSLCAGVIIVVIDVDVVGAGVVPVVALSQVRRARLFR